MIRCCAFCCFMAKTCSQHPFPLGNAKPSGLYYWVRKAVVILLPAYVLCCMFDVLETPRPLIRHAYDDARLAMGFGPRIFSADELAKEGVGRKPLLRWSVLRMRKGVCVIGVCVGSKRHGHFMIIALAILCTKGQAFPRTGFVSCRSWHSRHWPFGHFTFFRTSALCAAPAYDA